MSIYLWRSLLFLFIYLIITQILFDKNYGWIHRAGLSWTKGSLKAIDENTTKKVKVFKATIKKVNLNKKSKE